MVSAVRTTSSFIASDLNRSLSTISPQPITASGSDFRCFAIRPQRSTLANAEDCFQAIDRLPISGFTNLYFRRVLRPDPSDLWELPRSEVFRSFKVVVDLAYVRKKWSSWSEIGLAARCPTSACIHGTRTGGIVHEGASSGIRITVGNEQVISLSVSNSTDEHIFGEVLRLREIELFSET